MPRKYTRTSTRAQWSEDDLLAAAEALQRGTESANAISKEFGVPLRTLLRRVKDGNFRKGSLGPAGCLGIENEQKLVDYIQTLEKTGYAPSSKEIRHLAYTFAERNNIKHRFNKDKETAGYDWFLLFMKRHPNLRMRTAQGRSIARSLGMCHEEVDPYFKLLLDTLTEYDLMDQPRKIYNMDETGLQLNNKPGKVIATKGAKDVQTITSNEKGETISLIACCNAEGNFIPPYVVFRGKNKKKEFEDDMPPGSVVVMSPDSAYVKTHIFLSWVRDHFIPRKDPGPVLLILDGHASHCSDVNVLDFLAENEIILLCLPSHTTHWLQPLDRSFFKPLKSYWNSTCTNWIRSHPGRKITRYQFGELLNQAWGLAATNQNAVSGFEACGIFPYNPNKVPDYAFSVAERRAVAEGNNDNAEQGDDEEHTEEGTLNNSVPFHAISPIPVIPGCSKKNTRKQHAEIITSPEVRLKKRKKLEEKLEKELKKAEKNEKKKKTKQVDRVGKKAKRDVVESSSDSDVCDLVSDHSSDNIDSDSDEYCAICKGYYHDKTGLKVDWICCIICKKWLHETCTSHPNTCNNCSKKKGQK